MQNNNDMKKQPTQIDKNILGRKLMASFIKDGLKKGMTETQIKDAFTAEILSEMTKYFCDKYNFIVTTK